MPKDTTHEKVRKIREANDKVNEQLMDNNNKIRDKERAETLKMKQAITQHTRLGKQEMRDALAAEKWDKLAKFIADNKAEMYRGYNTDPIAVLFSLIRMSEAVGEALAASQPFTQVLEAIDSLIGVRDLASSSFDAFMYKSPPETVFLNYAEHVQMNDQGCLALTLENMKNRSGELIFQNTPLGNSIKNTMEPALTDAVEFWLKGLGYTKDLDSNKFYDDKKQQLTQAKFNDLRDDQTKGLASKLAEMLDERRLLKPTSPRP